MAKDLFSGHAAGYARYRPGYPEAMIAQILAQVHGRQAAWDCATGNGQAAILLAPHFDRVYATDISQQQLSLAPQHPSIHYSVSPAETTSFEDNSFDLITVAQAYHWLSFTAFHNEAARVGRPGCLIAIWGYGLIESADLALRTLIGHFYTDTIGAYWDPERKYIDQQYRTVPFPFSECSYGSFHIRVSWSKEDLLGYLNTWSSVQHFKKANGYNPIDHWAGELDRVWGAETTRTFSFPLFLRMGRL